MAAGGLYAHDVLGGGRIGAEAEVVPDAGGDYDVVLVAVRRDQLSPRFTDPRSTVSWPGAAACNEKSGPPYAAATFTRVRLRGVQSNISTLLQVPGFPSFANFRIRRGSILPCR